MSDDPSDPGDGYKVGYRRPPLATRFPPGTSGNPRGRPKGAPNLATVLASTLAERVVVTENGRRKRITKLEAAVKQLVNRAASGEARSMSLLLALIQASEAMQSGPLPAGFARNAGATILLRAASANDQPAKPDARFGAGGSFTNRLAEARAKLDRAEEAARSAAEIPGGGVSGLLAEALLAEE
jgi:Family of unknown function (DUF5681)